MVDVWLGDEYVCPPLLWENKGVHVCNLIEFVQYGHNAFLEVSVLLTSLIDKSFNTWKVTLDS